MRKIAKKRSEVLTLTARRRPELARRSGLDMNLRFPNPWQQILETVDWVTIDHPREHVGEVSVGFDAVEFAGFDQRTDDRPTLTTSVTACKQVVLAAERHRADRALDRVRVEFDAPIMQEARQALPARERIADRFGKRAAARYKRKLRLQPGMQTLNDWLGERSALSKPMSRRLPAHTSFDGIELADTAQGLSMRDCR